MNKARLACLGLVFMVSAHEFSFPAAALQKLVDDSIFAGTNMAAILQSTNCQGTRGEIRFMTPQRRDYFLANPTEGRVILNNVAQDILYTSRLHEAASSQAEHQQRAENAGGLCAEVMVSGVKPTEQPKPVREE